MTRLLAGLIDTIAHLVQTRDARRWCQRHGHQPLHGAWPPMCSTCLRHVTDPKD